MAGKLTIKRMLGFCFHFLASLKTAIPLLVLLTLATVVGSLFPQPELFKSWLYLGLLGALGVSLLFVTILHIPSLRQRRGRNAMIGVVATHAGILLLIAGAIYGGMHSFRYSVYAIEQEMTVVPGLPFVIRLDKLEVEEYPANSFIYVTPKSVPKKKQQSHITLFKDGEPWASIVTSPGRPAKAGNIHILPSLSEVGWYFELIITDPLGREKTIPVKPWAPPVIKAGDQRLMAHNLLGEDHVSVKLFTIRDKQVKPLGILHEGSPLKMGDYSIRLGASKRYTGLMIYNRPQTPVLVAGCFLMLAGLIWHFYHRHKDKIKPGTRYG